MADNHSGATPIEAVDRDPALRRLARDVLGSGWRASLAQHWAMVARAEQLPPPGTWRHWLILAGRGFGKTRAGAEWIDGLARTTPGLRCALVGATLDDARRVMVEGESGVLNLPGRQPPQYLPARRMLAWPGGSEARLYSAAEAEGLRGPQHHFAWADEVARWDSGSATGTARALAAWDNLMLGLRLGERPRVLATTTPRAVPLLKTIMALPDLVITGGSSRANAANLPPAFLDAMERHYGKTRLGRQELGGELIGDIEGALWTRAMIERCRRDATSVDGEEALSRVVIGVDPPASAHGDACGIIVAARLAGWPPRWAVLADASVEGARPESWARAVAIAAGRWSADRVVAEANSGGDMVRSVLNAADAALPVSLVHASRGKSARAEPVAVRYERDEVYHMGAFAELEDELCGLMAGGGYCGPGRSPDRADAMVWALTSLFDCEQGQPRLRWL